MVVSVVVCGVVIGTPAVVLGYVIGGNVLGGGVGRVGSGTGTGFTTGLIGPGADGRVRMCT